MIRILTICAAVAFASGCARLARAAYPPSPEPTALEEAIRERNQALEQAAELRVRNERLAYDLEQARIELQKCRAALEERGLEPAETAPAFREVPVDRIELGMLTGPSNWDGRPGYDGIAVYLQVKDPEGTTLKRVGNVLFELIDIEGGRQDVVMTWAVPAQVLLDSWQSLPPGYRMKLPWQGVVPWGHDVVFRATFTTAEGRELTESIILELEPEEAED